MPFKLKLHTWPYFWVQELFSKYLPKADFLYILVLRLVCLKMFISSQRNLPQLQYCASKLRNYTDFENLSI